MNENYLMLNGKRVYLTEEQIEKLGLYIEKEYFKRKPEQVYYFINCEGLVLSHIDTNTSNESLMYSVANYCTDKSLMHQRALYETLSRLLWRFSMQNGGDKIDWRNQNQAKYCIYFDNNSNTFNTIGIYFGKYPEQYFMQYFISEEIAQRAIDEIILPFMKGHPEFIW